MVNNKPHTRNIVRLMIVSHGYILLAKHQGSDKTHYFLPGGGIEYNESLIDAAQRELNEEIGVFKHDISSIHPVAVYEHSWDDKGKPFHEISIVCTCEVQNLSSDKPVFSQEPHLQFIWQKTSHLSEILFLPEDFKKLVPEWLKNNDQTSFFHSSMP